MATGNIPYNRDSDPGRLLKDSLRALETGYENLVDVIAQMEQMRVVGGDTGEDATYAEITLRYGFPNDATAHVAYNELASLLGKLNGNGSVENVNAAMLQVFNKFR